MSGRFEPEDPVETEAVARDLEALARSTTVQPTDDFVDRVMLAVDAEPLAAPAHAAGLALRRGAIGSFLAAFADAGRVTLRAGFPVAVRAQALALVLVVAALAAGSGVATAGALGFIHGGDGLPSPQPPIQHVPSPSVEPAPTQPAPATDDHASMEPPATTAPDESPSTGPEHPEGSQGAAPRESDHGDGSGAGSGGGSKGDNGGKATPRPTRSSGSGSGSGSGGSGDGGDDNGSGDGSDDGGSDGHASATETPEPSETPEQSDSGKDSSGSGGSSSHD